MLFQKIIVFFRCKFVIKKALFCYKIKRMKYMLNISNHIKAEIKKSEKEIFFLEDFEKIGNKNAIRQTLFRQCSNTPYGVSF